jgi:hypothetical protein
MKILFNILKSVLSAFIGIQKDSRLNEDSNTIEKIGLMPYFIAGLLLAIIFIILIFTLVSLILE